MFFNHMGKLTLWRSESPWSSEPKLFRTARQERHRVCNDTCIEMLGLAATGATRAHLARKCPGLLSWTPASAMLGASPWITTSPIIARNRLIAIIVKMLSRPLLRRAASHNGLPRERFRCYGLRGEAVAPSSRQQSDGASHAETERLQQIPRHA